MRVMRQDRSASAGKRIRELQEAKGLTQEDFEDVGRYPSSPEACRRLSTGTRTEGVPHFTRSLGAVAWPRETLSILSFLRAKFRRLLAIGTSRGIEERDPKYRLTRSARYRNLFHARLTKIRQAITLVSQISFGENEVSASATLGSYNKDMHPRAGVAFSGVRSVTSARGVSA